jgi:hypothetical protein
MARFISIGKTPNSRSIEVPGSEDDPLILVYFSITRAISSPEPE